MDLKPHEARDLVGRTLHDSGGESLGEVSGVYFNDADRSLEWVSIAVPASLVGADAQQEERDTSDAIASDGRTDVTDMSDERVTSDTLGASRTGAELRFVPAGALRTAEDRLSLIFSRDVLLNQPHIEPQDGTLSNAQVARLHEFFHTFDGQSRITTASEGEPPTAAVGEGGESTAPFTGRHHEPAFGTGSSGPGEPHDVTLQGTGNPAP
ncbi:PRC-barrel domain-containing protein [Kineosporia rhizophila]|uniref:PRC-barrel domain-containing protein n=1 Tax=Kineosporia rhizophila TaxID=84633 RepID=UPI000B030CF0|nr:PRC-barrel domain-containing protein [Kineosporia rhizophila]MCE0540252.1 PRC-barrel domain-containing protein [Kineosporia rhizophila]